MKSKKITEPIIWLDGGIGVSEPSGILVTKDDGGNPKETSQAVCGLTQATSGCVEEIAVWGKLERYSTPGGNLVAKMIFDDGRSVKWVPMTGKKNTRPKRDLAADSFRKGEALFNPSDYR